MDEKEIITFSDNLKIIDVLKVNNVVMYHLYDTDEDKYYLYFNYNGWCRCEVEATIEVHYINHTYVVFTPNNIFGFKYNFETSDWTYYESDTLVHIPIRNIVEGTTDTEYESDNVVTSQYITRYILESDIYTNTDQFNDRTILVSIGDTTYKVVWKSEYVYTLATKIGVVPVAINHLQINNNGILLAYNTADSRNLYYSIDGSIWKEFDLPTELTSAGTTAARHAAVTLSEDGSTVWAFSTSLSNGGCHIYYTILPLDIIGYESLTWQSLDITLAQEYSTVYSDGSVSGTDNTDGSKLSYTINKVETGTSISSDIPVRIHSAEDGVCVLLFGTTLSLTTLAAEIEIIPNAGQEYTLPDIKDVSLRTDLVVDTDISYEGYHIKYSFGDTSTDYEFNKHYVPCIILIKDGTATVTTSADVFACYDGVMSRDEFLNGLYSQETTQYMTRTKNIFFPWWDESQGYNYYDIRYYPGNSDVDIVLVYQYMRYNTFCYAMYIGDEPYWRVRTEQYGLITYLDLLLRYTISDDRWNYINYTGCILYDGLFEFDSFYKFQDGTVTTVSTGYHDDITRENPTLSNMIDCATDAVVTLTTTVIDNGFDLSQYSLSKDLTYNEYTEWLDVVMNKEYSTEYESSSEIKIREPNVDEYIYTSKYFKLNHDVDDIRVLTEYYYYVNKTVCDYFPIDDKDLLPIGFYDDYIYYYYTDSQSVYTTNQFGQIYVDDIQNDGDTNYNYLLPQFAETFITTTVAIQNKLYQVDNTEEDDGLLYIPKSSMVEIPDYITSLIVMSEALLGVFTAHTAYEYIYGTEDDEDDLTIYQEGYFYLIPTKLQLGNRRDYDVILGFDGSTIFLPTILGLSTLTYEQFIQTTEHVFNYISDNIYSLYKQYDIAPLKLAQFEYWILMYREDSNQIYLYDRRTSSWWLWTIPCNVSKIYYEDKTLYFVLDQQLYYVDFDSQDIYDYDGNAIEWKFSTQKLHFNYPNHYKHVNSLSVVTSQQDDKIRYDVEFTNYHNLYDTSKYDTVERSIETISTAIERVNFMKTNALQITISNDDTDNKPTQFVTSNIALKYRVTEKIR